METLINNAATVASLYEAFGQANIPFIVSHIAEDCEWIGAGEGFIPQGGTYKGKDAVNFFRRLGEGVEFNAFNPQMISNASENEVVAYGTMTCISRATGKPAVSDWAMRWRFNDEGKVIYFHDFHDTAAAYAANLP